MNRFVRPRRWLFLCLGAGVLLATGCGGDETKLVPAKVVVKIGGKPAKNIAVQLMPDHQSGTTGPTSMGITDEKGRAIMKTTDGREGAVPGTHKIVLADLDEERPPQGSRKPVKVRIVDPRYTVPGKNSPSAEVKEGSTEDIVINVIRRRRR